MLQRPLVALAALLAFTACAPRPPAPVTAPPPSTPGDEVSGARVAPVHWPDGSKKERVKLELYLMSKCRFGVDAIRAVKELVDAVGEQLELRIDYIATVDEQGKISSMHGEQEVEGDILQLCVQKLHPAPTTYLKFMACQGAAFASIPEGWERCADEAGVDRLRVRHCQKTNGAGLLRASLLRAAAANATGSPTIVLAGNAFQGDRSLTGLLRPLCAVLKGPAPARCRALPVDPEVHAIVLSDKRCPSCGTESMIQNLRNRFFPKLVVKNLDYGTPEGKKLYRELKIQHLPIVLFEASVEKAERYDTLKRWMTDVGSYKQLKVPASFDPTAEICDNKTDDNRDGKVDCADPTCTGKLVCRREIKRKLDVFVMSQCPFAVMGILAMEEVLKTFKGKLAFDLHYIVEKGQGGFTALHGPAEVAENQRQLCAKKLYRRGDLYLKYLWCRARNPRSDDWQSCATGKISAQKIEACVQKEGDALLHEDNKLTTTLGISASPSWLANNRHSFTGVTAAAITDAVCKHNPELAPCKNRSPASQPGTGASPGGSCGN